MKIGKIIKINGKKAKVVAAENDSDTILASTKSTDYLVKVKGNRVVSIIDSLFVSNFTVLP